MNRTRIIEKVHKLLNLKAGSDFEGEINAAVAGAQRLMQEHAISEAELAESREKIGTPEDAQVEYGRKHTFTQGSNLSRWESSVAHAVATTVGSVKWYQNKRCIRHNDAGFLVKGKSRTAARITFYGPAEDVALACDLQDDISTTIATMGILKYGGSFRGDGLSYCDGFAQELYTISNESAKAERVADAHNITTALALRTTQLAQEKRRKGELWLRNTEGIKLSKGSGYGGYNRNGEAHANGRNDGRAHGMTATRRAKLGTQGRIC